MRAWLAGHIFFRGLIFGEVCDRVVLEVAEPFVRLCQERGWIDGYFFIRYGELGSHVRLRLRGDPEVLEAVVKPALEAHVATTLPPDVAGEPETEAPAVARTRATASLLWMRYEPEVERYGVEEAVKVAEELFLHSSELALELLRGLPATTRSPRLGRGIAPMLTLISAFTTDSGEAAALARLHRDSFAGPADAREALVAGAFRQGGDAQAAALATRMLPLWRALHENTPLPPPLDAYRTGLRSVRERLQELAARGVLCPEGHGASGLAAAARILVPSYLHMTSNRLGIAPVEEAYLAHMVAGMLA